jgi:hypothetical protein
MQDTELQIKMIQRPQATVKKLPHKMISVPMLKQTSTASHRRPLYGQQCPATYPLDPPKTHFQAI